MKALLSICMFVTATFVWAGETPVPLPPKAAVVTGEVLEVKAVENFVYLRLKTQDGEIWAAVINTPVMKGSTVTIENAIVMKNFESKTLKKTFPMILFGKLGGAGGSTTETMTGTAAGSAAIATESAAGGAKGSTASSSALGTAYPILAKKKGAGAIHVPKASGANARTVAEVMKKGSELKDKTVLVRGQVVKYNAEIMGKNWIHLRDGSGSEADNTNDVLVTTTNQAKIGDVVTVKGVVHTDKDFGAGYAYKVLIEDATVQ